MADAPKHGWFRFILRTIFVAFTVVAVWLGWNVYKVRERKAAIEKWKKHPASEERVVVFTVKTASELGISMDYRPPETPKTSWIRQMLGDEPVSTVILAWEATDSEKASTRALFPEAFAVQISKQPR